MVLAPWIARIMVSGCRSAWDLGAAVGTPSWAGSGADFDADFWYSRTEFKEYEEAAQNQAGDPAYPQMGNLLTICFSAGYFAVCEEV
jgi:hypothetical protein